MYLTTQALVLRITDVNDRDALLTLLTQEYGKVIAKARGLRKKNSPLVAPCQLLAFGEFTLFEYRGKYTVNEAHSIELFQNLRRDLSKLSLGTYFAQVAEVMAQADQPDSQLLSLTLNCLHALSKLELPEPLVKAVFELRCASNGGYTPELRGCHICGTPETVYFDISGGTLLCKSCNGNGSGIRMPVSPPVLDSMRYITQCHPKRLFSFSLGKNELFVLSSVTEAYLAAQLERGFSALDFYKSLSV